MGLAVLSNVLSFSFLGSARSIVNSKTAFNNYTELKKKCLSLSPVTMSKSESWESSKAKYLQMDLEEKRRHYRTKEYFRVEDIGNWPEFAKENSPLLESLPLLVENNIDRAKNKECAEKISIFRGDITQLEVDAIVNAANSSLLGGGGVDGAIHRAAGHLLKDECKTLQGCQVGEAKLTGGYKLPARYVIHTVGPQGEKPDKLKQCYKNCLDLAVKHNLRTVAFPCISTGIYGYPLAPAAHIAAMEVRKQLEANPEKFSKVIFCLFAEIDKNIYTRILQSYFPLE